jgi:hypothetical protein
MQGALQELTPTRAAARGVAVEAEQVPGENTRVGAVGPRTRSVEDGGVQAHSHAARALFHD